jgi:hypothetical protein
LATAGSVFESAVGDFGAAGYTKPDPPIEVGVIEYQNSSEQIAAFVRCVETDALSGPNGRDMTSGIDRLVFFERSMSRAEFPQ